MCAFSREGAADTINQHRASEATGSTARGATSLAALLVGISFHDAAGVAGATK
jgi:hypothetical protein